MTHTLRVYLYGKFRSLAPVSDATAESYVDLEVTGPEDIRGVIRRLGIPEEEVSHIFLNGQYSAATRKVKAGDRLGIFPKDMALLYRQYFPVEED